MKLGKAGVKTAFLVLFYCVVWMFLEVILYGEVQNRAVDDIMMFMFIPAFYKAMKDK